MFDLVGFILLALLGSVITALINAPRPRWKHWFAEPAKGISKLTQCYDEVTVTTNARALLQDITDLAECHETPALLSDLIHKDGAGDWPPRSNHLTATWPAALRPYRVIYEEMAPLLPTATASLDDEVNRLRIVNFRSHFKKLLHDQVDLAEVEVLLKAAEAGQWDLLPRDTYNGFYSCIAWCRHAYRYVLFRYNPPRHHSSNAVHQMGYYPRRSRRTTRKNHSPAPFPSPSLDLPPAPLWPDFPLGQ